MGLKSHTTSTLGKKFSCCACEMCRVDRLKHFICGFFLSSFWLGCVNLARRDMMQDNPQLSRAASALLFLPIHPPRFVMSYTLTLGKIYRRWDKNPFGIIRIVVQSTQCLRVIFICFVDVKSLKFNPRKKRQLKLRLKAKRGRGRRKACRSI